MSIMFSDAEYSTFVKDVRTRFVTAFREMIIMIFLRDAKELTGYDVLRAILKRYDVLPNNAVVYTGLRSLEVKGLINRSKLAGGRKVMNSLTSKGDLMLAQMIKEYDSVAGLIPSTK